MSMVINHNVPALQTYNIVNGTSNALQKSIAKLSSGLRINSAADDAAGLAISEKMRSQVSGLDKAVANTQDGISLIQTAEGALQETHSILQRMRELSVQAANDTLTQQDRSYIQVEIDQLNEEITRIGNTTQFNKKKLLNGEAAALWSSDNLETKAIINGGLRKTDQFGQKVSVEGNYKISVKADPGQAEVQKSDIMKIKHDDVVINKSVNTDLGIKDVSVTNTPAGHYDVTLGQAKLTVMDNGTAGEALETSYGDYTDDNLANGEKVDPILTGSYGIGGVQHETTSAVILEDGVGAPVTKITIQTTDGIEIWSTTGSDLFKNIDTGGSTTASAQASFFLGTDAGHQVAIDKGQTDETLIAPDDPEFAGVMNEIISAARDKGITLTAEGFNDDGTLTGTEDNADTTGANAILFKAMTMDGKAPGIEIKYETSATAANPSSTLIQDSNGAAVITGGLVNDISDTSTLNLGTNTINADEVFDLRTNGGNLENASILFEVTHVDAVNNKVTLKATATKLSQNGTNSTTVQDNIVLGLTEDPANAGQFLANEVKLDKLLGTAPDVDAGGAAAATPAGPQIATINLNTTGGGIASIKDGAKFVYFVGASQYASDNTTAIGVNIKGSLDTDWEDKWDGGPFNGKELSFVMNGDALDDTEIHFKTFNLNEKTGVVNEGDITLSTDSTFKVTNGKLEALGMQQTAKNAEVWIPDATLTNTNNPSLGDLNGAALASFEAAYIGKVASGDTKLRDLDKFWNSEGVFMLDDAKTITLNQGNGNKASVTLYANDTLDDVAKKLNDAIANGLGQAKYVDDATKFATFVGNGSTKNSESVDGTFVLRSVVPGKSGEITLSGDEAVLNAFSLNTIQKSKETSFNVDVQDAHTGQMIAQNVKITGNVAHGLIDENVDVEFSELSGINAKWNDNLNKFTYTSSTESTTLHLADNTTVLQIGANEGEDLAMNIGDMRSHALGLDGVNVMSHDRAARSITIIDNAIDKVSTQRANLGAYQNRLEYTASNLTTASENLTSAESRIRDTDMAKEMMNFTKLNIMLQAGNSMLAQANQQPQNVLSLIR